MLALYNIGIHLYQRAAQLSAFFGNEKAKKFIQGRKNIFIEIAQSLEDEQRPRIWVHASSLGEFEQARPIIESLKQQYPDYALILTFFSPSGYEVRKNYAQADYVFYLPLDNATNSQRFLYFVQPTLALFTKYDYWYHYLHRLHKANIPIILFSAIYQARQPFFKWYGSLHRKMLQYFNHIFVQDQHSISMLHTINVDNASVAGDTRLDRVLDIAASPFKDEVIENFIDGRKCIVVGSAWPEDWKLILESYEQLKDEYCVIIAPHELSSSNLNALASFIDHTKYSYQLYTNFKVDQTSQVLILDTMGMLSFIYRYGTVAWIGGGFQKSGIHNILEVATYALPIFIGPNYSKFHEANVLVTSRGAHSTQSSEDFVSKVQDKEQLDSMKVAIRQYIQTEQGAVEKIINYISKEKLL